MTKTKFLQLIALILLSYSAWTLLSKISQSYSKTSIFSIKPNSFSYANQLSNIISTEITFSATINGSDPYIVFPINQTLKSKYLRLKYPANHTHSSFTVFYGLIGQNFSPKNSLTRRTNPDSEVVEFPLPDGQYNSIRIDFDGNSLGESVSITQLSIDDIGRTTKPNSFFSTLWQTQKIVTQQDFFPSLTVIPGQSFWIENTGSSPILNPRFIAEGGLDLTSYNHFLSSLAQSSANGDSEQLLINTWKYLGKEINHHCSPGRKNRWITDPLELIAGYGYGCCTHTNRAITKMAEHLGFESNFVSTHYHEYPEIKLSKGWQILDANRGQRWFSEDGQTPLLGRGFGSGEPSVLNRDSAYLQNVNGDMRLIDGNELQKHQRDLNDKFAASQDYNITGVNPDRQFFLYPGDKLTFHTATAVLPLTHQSATWNPPHVAQVTLDTTIRGNKPDINLNTDGYTIAKLNTVLPFPLLSFEVQGEVTELQLDGEVVGAKTNNGAIVTREHLDHLSIDRNLNLSISATAEEINLSIKMQYNPKLFGLRVFEYDGRIESEETKKLNFQDDSGHCSRQLILGQQSRSSPSITTKIQTGTQDCSGHNVFQILKRDLRGYSLWDKVRHIKSCTINHDGLHNSESNANCEVVFTFKNMGLSNAILKLDHLNNAHVELKTGKRWQDAKLYKSGRYSWIEITDVPVQNDQFLLRISSKTANEKAPLLRGLSYEIGSNTMLPHFLKM